MSEIITNSEIYASRELRKLENMILESDILYQATLDRLEVQARDALLVDKAIRQVFSHSNDARALWDLNPEKTLSPRTIFLSLVGQVIQAARKLKGVSGFENISQHHYSDLLTWDNEPVLVQGESALITTINKIDYARSKSLQKFWDRLVLRIKPEQNPDLALKSATTDLADAFGINLQNNLILPYENINPAKALLLDIDRGQDGLEWTIHDRAREKMTRAGHALVMLCKLNNDVKNANTVAAVSQTTENKLIADNCLYRPGDLAGDREVVQVQFMRNYLHYRLGPDVWPYVWDALPQVRPDVVFTEAKSGI